PQAAPARPAPPAPAPAPAPAAPAPAAPPPAVAGAEVSRLRGAAARTVTNMTASLAVPTATSVRAIPAKLLVDNRIVINNHLRRGRGGKVSFTHLIGFAVVKALVALPEMNLAYAEENGKPARAASWAWARWSTRPPTPGRPRRRWPGWRSASRSRSPRPMTTGSSRAPSPASS